MKIVIQPAELYDHLGKWMVWVIWLWAILSVKAMADGVVRMFFGNEYVILSMWHFHWGILLGVFPLVVCLGDQEFLPLTRTMRIWQVLILHVGGILPHCSGRWCWVAEMTAVGAGLRKGFARLLHPLAAPPRPDRQPDHVPRTPH